MKKHTRHNSPVWSLGFQNPQPRLSGTCPSEGIFSSSRQQLQRLKRFLLNDRFRKGGLALLFLNLGLFLGCSNWTALKEESAAKTRPEIFQPPQPATFPEYRLGFGDVVEVKFFNNPRFNETVAVRPDGRISLEKMDEVFVIGMTPARLDSLVSATYARFVVNPEVTVFVRQFGGGQVYVLGEVKSPGGYPLQKDMTLLQALTAAGGPTQIAKLKSVLLLRPGPNREIHALRLDLSRALHADNAAVSGDAVHVQAQDVIYVPKTFIGNVSTFLKQVYDGVLPPVNVYLQALWWSNR
jgi:protein involved in polysaccharide export with SLBB domain